MKADSLIIIHGFTKSAGIECMLVLRSGKDCLGGHHIYTDNQCSQPPVAEKALLLLSQENYGIAFTTLTLGYREHIGTWSTEQVTRSHTAITQ